ADATAVGLVPIEVTGEVVAVLELVAQGQSRFGGTERELVVALTRQAGVALERDRLREELARRASGAEALHRIAASNAGRRDIRELGAETVTALQDLYRADAAVFYTARTDEGEPEDIPAVPLVALGISESAFVQLHGEYAGQRRA